MCCLHYTLHAAVRPFKLKSRIFLTESTAARDDAISGMTKGGVGMQPFGEQILRYSNNWKDEVIIRVRKLYRGRTESRAMMFTDINGRRFFFSAMRGYNQFQDTVHDVVFAELQPDSAS